MASTTALGWTLPTGSGSRRVGPHIAHPDNPRELRYRNDAVADLLSGVIWLVHTGNGNESRKLYVSQAHSERPLGSTFGAKFSDHHCWVALDINWSVHPWEVNTGRTAYDNHLAASSLAWQHQLFRDVQKRLGDGRIVRWCGEDWLGPRRTGYLRSVGNRDCMHWVIEGPYWDRINAAADKLRTWFRPPRTVADIKHVQRVVNVKQDGVWGHGSVTTMYAWERKNGLTPTGLPGTVAFWKKVNAMSTPSPAPKPPAEPSGPTLAQRVAPHRLAGSNAVETAIATQTAAVPSGRGLIVFNRSAFLDADNAMTLQRRAAAGTLALPINADGSVPSVVLTRARGVSWVRAIGGAAVVPSSALSKVLSAANIKH